MHMRARACHAPATPRSAPTAIASPPTASATASSPASSGSSSGSSSGRSCSAATARGTHSGTRFEKNTNIAALALALPRSGPPLSLSLLLL